MGEMRALGELDKLFEEVEVGMREGVLVDGGLLVQRGPAAHRGVRRIQQERVQVIYVLSGHGERRKAMHPVRRALEVGQADAPALEVGLSRQVLPMPQPPEHLGISREEAMDGVGTKDGDHNELVRVVHKKALAAAIPQGQKPGGVRSLSGTDRLQRHTCLGAPGLGVGNHGHLQPRRVAHVARLAAVRWQRAAPAPSQQTSVLWTDDLPLLAISHNVLPALVFDPAAPLPVCSDSRSQKVERTLWMCERQLVTSPCACVTAGSASSVEQLHSCMACHPAL
eukprot:1508558-Prymnesium_polylepis.2